jgi:hypothetical protein
MTFVSFWFPGIIYWLVPWLIQATAHQRHVPSARCQAGCSDEYFATALLYWVGYAKNRSGTPRSGNADLTTQAMGCSAFILGS